MSLGIDNEVLKPILLRSSTPAPNEKVLKYLEGLEPGDPIPEDWERASSVNVRAAWAKSPPKSPVPLLHSPSPKASGDGTPQQLQRLADSVVSYGDVHKQHDDDIDSNVQDGQRSGLASLRGYGRREPGPQDPPGPRYESFDSGPSFGNKGPLPGFSTFQPTWNLDDAQGSNPASPRSQNPDLLHTGANQARSRGGTTPGPLSPSVGFNVVSASSLPRSQAPSKPSGKTTSSASPPTPPSQHGVVTPPMSPRRAASQQPTGDLDRAMSPVRSQKSHITGRTRGTEYPPLPTSAFEGSERGENPSSPLSQSNILRHNKAPSVSPSDSQSQVHVKRMAAARSPPPIEPSHNGNAELSPRSGPRQLANGSGNRAASGQPMSPHSHQNRPFSPYRHAHTQEDLLHAALIGQALQHQKQPSAHPSAAGHSQAGSKHEHPHHDADSTPTQSRPHSPDAELNADEERIVAETLGRTPRTSYAPSELESELVHSHFHDMELCVLLHEAEDPSAHEVVKKAVRKAVRQRIKKLGMKSDAESLKQYKRSFHNHNPEVHLQPDFRPQASEEAPEWARELMDTMARVQQRLDGLAPKIERLPSRPQLYPGSDTRYRQEYQPEDEDDDDDEYGRTLATMTVNIQTQPTGTVAESMFPPETELVDDRQEVLDYDLEEDDPEQDFPATIEGETRTRGVSDFQDGRDDSPGQQFLEEELYKLRVKPVGSQSALSHRTWEVARDDGKGSDDDDDEGTQSGLPEIPDSNGDGFGNARPASPPLPPLPTESQQELLTTHDGSMWPATQNNAQQGIAPWQRVHQRLLSWAIIWPMSELDNALNSTTRGHQIDEVALSIWTTQCYKRYVRAKVTDHPPGRVDRLFVPPNMADAISTSVFNGRHGDASAMLRELWDPFGLEGMPRLLVVLAKHRTEDNHWVVHRYSLPEGALSTYDSFPEKTLPDGRPLGWWFAIRIAWPNASYPSPDNLVQKMVRLQRPMQLGIDNSVAAAGIWRNVLMGTRAERSVDLERLRDLINTEVKNLRQRKQMGKLSIGGTRPNWDDFN